MAFLRKTALWIPLIPIVLFLGGVASNQAVLIANHDRFPVLVNHTKLVNFEAETVETPFGSITVPRPAEVDDDGVVMIDDIHCVMTSDTHLNALADIFDFGGIYSIGDFMLMLGQWLLEYSLVVWLVVVILRLRA